MHKSVTEAGYNGDNIRLIIKVSKGENDLVSFNVAVLLVSISGRNSCNADILPTESVCQMTGNLGLLIGLIITGVLLFAVIVCLVIAISLLMKKTKDSSEYDVPAPPTDHDNYARIDVNMVNLRNTNELRNTYENEFHS
ncbi:uncharacterized protein LOC127866360 [Dreissena polymorpha]|uniref:uncharacterized protein LOC127866360 n=1 Tax=Dreissena polymorpha TaxID=45954 RepID=UPI0022645ECB|nr:uncharacterized protein LOC127866360 [Dreissena polymorpha]